jgi:hypothetical protein
MRVAGLVGLMILLVAGAAMAGVPSSSTSTVDRAGQGTPACNPNTAVVCPAGDMGSVLVTGCRARRSTARLRWLPDPSVSARARRLRLA